jgi:hypothetical protein
MADFGFNIVIDFDGTVVKHRYPDVGEDIGAVPILRRLVDNGHKLILNTMRSRNCEGVDTLQPAIDWFASHGIPLYGINKNPTQKEWTSSPKVYGHLYIDDAALGAPLKQDKGRRPASPYIDWEMVAVHLFYYGCLSENDLVELVRSGAITEEVVHGILI